jgi:pre-rRNA-processing protein IPI1
LLNNFSRHACAAIVLPNQSLAAEKDRAQPTTRRQLSLQDLVNHLKHYNAGTRVGESSSILVPCTFLTIYTLKDAILGLRELLGDNSDLISTSLSKFISTCARLISDEDASVRRNLFGFLSWLLPLVPEVQLQPHASLLLLFASSALSHIFPEIRVDAAKILNLLLECMPEKTTQGWDANEVETSDERPGRRLLQGCLSVLNVGHGGGDQKGKKLKMRISQPHCIMRFCQTLLWVPPVSLFRPNHSWSCSPL